MNKFEISVRIPLIIEADDATSARQIAGNILGENSHFFADMFGALNMPDDSEPSIYAVELYRKENPARHDMRVILVAHDDEQDSSVYYNPRDFDLLNDELENLGVESSITIMATSGHNRTIQDGVLLVESQHSFEDLENAKQDA